MFGMSLKSVPGSLVAMAPSLIGVPEAFWPVPRPHLDAATAGLAVVAVLPPPPADDVFELSLLPHAATTIDRAATSAINAPAGRTLFQPKDILAFT